MKKNMKKEEEDEKYCGNCCWFYGEMTCGDGFCAEAKGNVWLDFVNCNDKCRFTRGGCDNPCFVSRQQMRHHMAVLLQERRWQEWYEGKREGKIELPDATDVIEARDFAYRYMKVFSKL